MKDDFICCIIQSKRGYGMSMYHTRALFETYKKHRKKHLKKSLKEIDK